jgi:small-conductance mechanosensitive channel
MWDTIVYGEVTLFELCIAISIIIIGVIIGKMFSVSMRRSLKDNLEPYQLRIVIKVTYFTFVIITIIIALPFLGLNWEGLLVAGGFAGLVIAFAAQSIISNFFAGIFLFVEHPIKIGDTVNIEGAEGTVEDVKLLSTVIRGYDGYLFRLPNEKVFTNKITNFSATKVRRFEYEIGIRYQDDPSKATEIVRSLIDEHVYILKNPGPHIFVDELGDNSVNLIIRVWAPVPVWYDVKMEFLQNMRAALEASGIEIPFPQRTLWLANNSSEDKNLRNSITGSRP